MPDPQIEKLLIVQDRDARLQKLDAELDRAPRERASLEEKIRAENAKVEETRRNLQAKEVERSELEQEVRSKEDAAKRFRTQQLEVRKNDEYQALTHEIERMEKEASELEEKELALLMEIDEIREQLERERKSAEEQVEKLNGQLEVLAEREENLRESRKAAESEVAQAREPVDEIYLEHFDRIKRLVRRAPYVVPVEEHKCGGCHLRVSNEILKEARDPGQPTFCDQCGRMVYVE